VNDDDDCLFFYESSSSAGWMRDIRVHERYTKGERKEEDRTDTPAFALNAEVSCCAPSFPQVHCPSFAVAQYKMYLSPPDHHPSQPHSLQPILIPFIRLLSSNSPQSLFVHLAQGSHLPQQTRVSLFPCIPTVPSFRPCSRGCLVTFGGVGHLSTPHLNFHLIFHGDCVC
jgi:hypothetical protein